MNKMTRMTPEQLKVHLDALGLRYHEESDDSVEHLSFYSHEYKYRRQLTNSDAEYVTLKDLGIELIKPEPEINIENLGKFMAMYREMPEATFSRMEDGEVSDTYAGTLKAVYIDAKGLLSYEDESGEAWPYCVIDQRWQDLEDKWKEYVKGVG